MSTLIDGKPHGQFSVGDYIYVDLQAADRYGWANDYGPKKGPWHVTGKNGKNTKGYEILSLTDPHGKHHESRFSEQWFQAQPNELSNPGKGYLTSEKLLPEEKGFWNGPKDSGDTSVDDYDQFMKPKPDSMSDFIATVKAKRAQAITQVIEEFTGRRFRGVK